MSGCARCVYDLYAEDLQDYRDDLRAARQRILAAEPKVSQAEWDEDLLGQYPKDDGDTSIAAQGKAQAQEDVQDEVDAVISNLDPSMRAFLEMERRLKRKQQGNL